jgi:hypothetical protein
MNLHEYQGKQLFAEYGLPVSRGLAAVAPKRPVRPPAQIGGDVWVVKAQVHAGGRGKAGGVKLVKTLDEVEQFARDKLGTRLVTYQTDSRWAARQPRFWWKPAPTSTRNCIWVRWSTVPSQHRLHGVHRRWGRNRKGGPRSPEKILQGHH